MIGKLSSLSFKQMNYAAKQINFIQLLAAAQEGALVGLDCGRVLLQEDLGRIIELAGQMHRLDLRVRQAAPLSSSSKACRNETPSWNWTNWMALPALPQTMQ